MKDASGLTVHSLEKKQEDGCDLDRMCVISVLSGLVNLTGTDRRKLIKKRKKKKGKKRKKRLPVSTCNHGIFNLPCRV